MRGPSNITRNVASRFRRDAVQLVLVTSNSEMRLPVRVSEELHIRFRHSVYGSTVEEAFVIGASGLELRQLRYEEPRLADYYGHDHSTRVGDWWVVNCNGHLHPELSLRVSADSEMRLSVGAHVIELKDLVRAGGAVRISVDHDRECDAGIDA